MLEPQTKKNSGDNCLFGYYRNELLDLDQSSSRWGNVLRCRLCFRLERSLCDSSRPWHSRGNAGTCGLYMCCQFGTGTFSVRDDGRQGRGEQSTCVDGLVHHHGSLLGVSHDIVVRSVERIMSILCLFGSLIHKLGQAIVAGWGTATGEAERRNQIQCRRRAGSCAGHPCAVRRSPRRCYQSSELCRDLGRRKRFFVFQTSS
mmetsp:Transcript_4569/g.8674  ORF Transcript_4569/g.8674 Transcript_4569/m.8674 type:complete len:202 (-) Transcript_4569:457-1062(-)